jgi:hypothetical protein
MSAEPTMQGEVRGGPPRVGTAVLVVSLVLTALVTGLGYVKMQQRLDAAPLIRGNNPRSVGYAFSVVKTMRLQIETVQTAARRRAAGPRRQRVGTVAQRTTGDGSVSEGAKYGPYLDRTPTNPLNGLQTWSR